MEQEALKKFEFEFSWLINSGNRQIKDKETGKLRFSTNLILPKVHIYLCGFHHIEIYLCERKKYKF